MWTFSLNKWNIKKGEKVFHGKFQVSKGFKKSVSKRRSSGCTIEAQKCTSVASLIQNISSSWQIFVGRKESRKQVIYLCPQPKLIKMFFYITIHFNLIALYTYSAARYVIDFLRDQIIASLPLHHHCFLDAKRAVENSSQPHWIVLVPSLKTKYSLSCSWYPS